MASWNCCRTSILLCFIIPASQYVSGQNVGIGVIDPVAKLHVGNGSVRFDGPPVPGGNIFSLGGYGAFSIDAPGIAAGRFIIRENGNVGVGVSNPQHKLEVNGDGFFYYKLGIGTNPIYPLHFGLGLGEKISFYGNGLEHYGIGVQPYLFQFYMDNSASNIGFGYGSSTNFTELMRIRGNGNVGIGTTSPNASIDVARGSSSGGTAQFRGSTHISHFNFDNNENTYIRAGKNNGNVIINDIPGGNVGIGNGNPEYVLDVNSRIRVRSNGSSAGIWFNSSSNTIAAFVGLENDTHVGFYGLAGANWNFTMNTQTGALKINGSEGTAGQVLQSNGTSSPTWGSATNSLYQNTFIVQGGVSTPITDDNTWVALPGLTYSFNVPGNAKVIVNANIEVVPGSCFNCGYTRAYIGIFLNGTEVKNWHQDIPNGAINNLSGNHLVQLGPGSHTIELRGKKSGPAAYFVTGGVFGSNNMILQVIRE